MKENTKICFTNQTFFIGIDVHKRSWTVTIRTNQMELKTFSMDPCPKTLFQYMTSHYTGGSYHSVYEAGYCGFWIHDKLTEIGFNNIVINPADVPTTNKEKYSKTDPVDSRKLARELEKGSLKGIYVPDLFHQQFRNLCRLRAQTVQNQTRTKNRIKSFISLYGIKMPARSELCHWSKSFINWLESLEFACSPGQTTLRLLIQDLQNQRHQLLQITKEIRKQVKDPHIQPFIGYLRSVFGIGFVSAVTLYSELIDIHRFPDFDHLASYVGLIPSVKASGEQSTTRGMTKRQSSYLRSLLIEAAWIAVRRDPALTLKYSELSRRMPKNKAIIRIAKKLLSRIRYVWINQSPYIPAIVE